MVFVFTLLPRGLIAFCTLRVALLTGVDVCFIFFHVVCGCWLLFVCDCLLRLWLLLLSLSHWINVVLCILLDTPEFFSVVQTRYILQYRRLFCSAE